ncbi:KP4 killer toxin [Cladobotryum mycophilum]|uniref:KP4 killer toxin n=1 Tax=Cladobotryum mycophilum TaxID=491253 RepID=A0ABR0SWB7_9HYPO
MRASWMFLTQMIQARDGDSVTGMDSSAAPDGLSISPSASVGPRKHFLRKDGLSFDDGDNNGDNDEGEMGVVVARKRGFAPNQQFSSSSASSTSSLQPSTLQQTTNNKLSTSNPLHQPSSELESFHSYPSSKFLTFSSIIAAAAMTIGVSAEGINCHGSSNCGNVGFKLTWLRDQVAGIDDNRWWQNGQHIACWENVAGTGFCAFLQNTGGMPGRDIKRLMQELVNHGCGKCGSVPVFFPNDNDNSHHGILTVNYVFKPHCNGRC